MRKKLVLKTALFLIVFSMILSVVSKILVTTGDYHNYQIINCFYGEKEDSLDAVYIGGSSTYTFWESPIAWHNYGITMYPFASNGQPLDAALYMLKEARKTQPNSLYLINIAGIYDPIPSKHIHWLTAYMPFSVNRFRVINALCDVSNTSFSERMEFYFPLLRFHSRWNELRKEDFHYTNDGLKGASRSATFLNTSIDVSSDFTKIMRQTPLRDSLQKSLDDLLDYCDSEKVRVLFVMVPQSRADDVFWAKINTINNYVQSRGYSCLNLLDYIEETGLDLTTDYYNGNHTNIHGALKTTKFLAEYLVKEYGFKDKRGGEDRYSSWDTAYDKYMKIIMPYALDIETNYEKRDYTLMAPKLNNIIVNGTVLTISWNKSENAEGYRVYRKEGNSPWMILGAVDRATLKYTDRNCKRDKTYTYTVVPWHMADGEKAWGRFNIKGVKAKALLNAPELVSLYKIDGGVQIVWKKVKGAAGYKVFRRLPDKNWIMLDDVKNTDSYFDTAVLDNLPFCYTVRGYTMDKDKGKIDGSQNPEGLLYLPELTMTTVVVAVNNGEVTLSWDTAEGMNGYKVYRNEELIAELPNTVTQFTDKPGDGKYLYCVKAFFKFDSDVHTFKLNNSFEWIDVSN